MEGLRRRCLSPIAGCIQHGTFQGWVNTSLKISSCIATNIKKGKKSIYKHQEYKGSCSGGDQDMDVTTIVYNSYYQVTLSFLPCFWRHWPEFLVFFLHFQWVLQYNPVFQWVPLYLIFNALLFYCPRLCWLSMEGGLMKFFGKGTTTRCPHFFFIKSLCEMFQRYHYMVLTNIGFIKSKLKV